LFGICSALFYWLSLLMNENFDQILAGIPEKRSRSRLEPYAVLIHELLHRRRTYREISCILLDQFQMRASISTIHDYVHRWTIRAGKARKSNVLGPDHTARRNPTDMAGKMQLDATGGPGGRCRGPETHSGSQIAATSCNRDESQDIPL
jgi:hypothetical protein